MDPENQMQYPDFTTTVLLVLEMLKRGAGVVDIHHMGIRLRDHGSERDAWSVGLIPQHAAAEYAESLMNPLRHAAEGKESVDPTMEEKTDDAQDPPGGAT
jgi:hypothetical protein